MVGHLKSNTFQLLEGAKTGDETDNKITGLQDSVATK